MMKSILKGIFFPIVAVASCPNLEGTFTYSGAATISVAQSSDASDITTYKVTIDDGTCAICHTDTYLKADGLEKQKAYERANEVTKVSCENNRMKFRQTTDYLNEEGVVVLTEKIHQDYRINADNNLVIENVENETPVSKVVYPRLL